MKKVFILLLCCFLFVLCTTGCNEDDAQFGIIRYTVTFASNGGSAVPEQRVENGKVAVEPNPAPVRGSLVLDGWYTDNNTFKNKWNFATPVTGSFTLYAYWTGGTDPHEYPPQEYLVGVSYFNGWWEGEGNGWHNWRPQYPGRIPLLGEVSSQETMNKEIIAASEYGVDFFQILWYPMYNRDHISDMQAQHLNEGITFFMASPENHRMRFSIEYCNHAPFALTDEDNWKEACAEIVSYMQHPAYLRIDGKALFKIHTVYEFRSTDAGNDENAVKWLRYLRDLARAEGVGELLIGAGAATRSAFMGMPELMAEFDYVQLYNGFSQDLPQTSVEYEYEVLADYALEEAKRLAAVSYPCIPYVMAGWNPRPWTGGAENQWYYKLPTRLQWRNALTDMKNLLDTNTGLGIPVEAGRQKIFCIYAWNEFGEGGMVAPTQGDGYMLLDEIQRVFKQN